jgi:hypothetical protein
MIIGLLYWATILTGTMDGIENCALRPEIPFMPVLMLKKMETNIDALMSFMHMKCGAQTTLEESIHKEEDSKNKSQNSMIKLMSTISTDRSKLLQPEDGFKRSID